MKIIITLIAAILILFTIASPVVAEDEPQPDAYLNLNKYIKNNEDYIPLEEAASFDCSIFKRTWKPDNEFIDDLEIFDSKISGIVGNGESKSFGFIDINLVTSNGSEEIEVYELENPIEVMLFLDDDIYNSIKDKDQIKVLRQHYDENGSIIYDVLPDANVKLEGRVLTIRSSKFSTYAIIGFNNAPVKETESATVITVTHKPVVNTAVK